MGSILSGLIQQRAARITCRRHRRRRRSRCGGGGERRLIACVDARRAAFSLMHTQNFRCVFLTVFRLVNKMLIFCCRSHQHDDDGGSGDGGGGGGDGGGDGGGGGGDGSGGDKNGGRTNTRWPLDSAVRSYRRRRSDSLSRSTPIGLNLHAIG